MQMCSSTDKARRLWPTLRIGVSVALWLAALAMGLRVWAEGRREGLFQSLRTLTATTSSTLKDLATYGTVPAWAEQCLPVEFSNGSEPGPRAESQ